MKKNLRTILDLSVEEIDAMLARASVLKEKWKKRRQKIQNWFSVGLE